MVQDNHNQEQRVLQFMRKTLARVVVDLTPKNAFEKYPLSPETVESVKTCFDLISAREKKLAEEKGVTLTEKPYFKDEPRIDNVVSLDKLYQKDNQ